MNNSGFNCSTCNAPNASNARFCTHCGASLMRPKTEPAPYRTPTSQFDGALVSAYAFAGFWKRFIAYILDTFIFALVFLLLAFLAIGADFDDSLENPHDIKLVIGLFLLYYPAWWLYFALMESSSLQATLGKKAMGIKVTDKQGQPLEFTQATGRHFAAFITRLTLFIGDLMAGFTARKQALHDMIASTLVVNKRYDASQIKVASDNPAPGMTIGGIIAIVFLVLLVPMGGILAAIAIPAYQDYTLRANISQAVLETKPLQKAMASHATETGYWPNSLQQTGLEFQSEQYRVKLTVNGGYQIIFNQPKAIQQKRLDFAPELNESGGYNWQCSSDDLKPAYLPPRCR